MVFRPDAPGVEALRALTWLRIDDRRGREAAAAHGVEIIGTLGVLVEARQRGVLSGLLAPILDRLIAVGFRADAALLRRALAAVGEAD